jgi:hypothetical protein
MRIKALFIGDSRLLICQRLDESKISSTDPHDPEYAEWPFPTL